MHEHSFIQAIVSGIENKENVMGIVIEVGELAGIEAGHLKEHLVEETGWKVNISFFAFRRFFTNFFSFFVLTSIM